MLIRALLGFYNDDDDKTFDIKNNVLLYRTSLYKTKNGNIFTHIQDLGEMGINSYDSDNIKKYK